MSTVSNQPGLLLTLHRGIQVLEQVARDQGRATAKSLSADLKINSGTCYQLLRTLQVNGYVHRLPGGRYGLGSRVGFLADHYNASIAPPPELIDILHRLHQEVQETVYISIRRGRKIEVAAVLEGTKPLRVGKVSVGYSDHPHIRASTKAFLAFSEPDQLDEFFEDHTLVAMTPKSITDWNQLLGELRTTRQRGFGIDDQEFCEGVSCVGAVVLDGNGDPFASYGISFPSATADGAFRALAARVVRAGEEASRAMGYTGDYPTVEA